MTALLPPTIRTFKILTATLLLVLLAPAAARAQEKKIEEVKFEGLRSLTHEELLRKIESRPGLVYKQEHVSADLKRLAPLAYWAHTRVEDTDNGNVRVIFVLRENPMLETIHIIGNKKIETANLEKLIRVKPGEVLTSDAVAKAQEAIENEYHSEGFPRTEVKATLATPDQSATQNDPTQPTRRVLQITINEGQKKKVDTVHFSGNQNFSSLRLKTVIDTNGSWLFIENYYDEAIFEEDLKALALYYHRRGYFDAQAERGVFAEDHAKETITPAIAITEGPRYRFGSVTAKGNTYFTHEEIEALFAPLEGKNFEADSFEMALGQARDLYGQTGFITTEIRDELTFDTAAGLVNVTLNIDEKARATIGNIIVERKETALEKESSWFARTYHRLAPPIDNAIIEREITMKRGQVYDKRLEEESVAKLRGLGVFDEVAIESRSTDSPGVRDVVIKTEEGITGNILVGVGYDGGGDNIYNSRGQLGAFVFARYTERNLLGHADSLQLNITAGTKEINGGVTYFDRHFLDTDKSLLSEIRYIHAYRPGYDESNAGVLAELGMPLSKEWKAYTRARLEYVSLDEGDYDPVDQDYNIDYMVAALRLKFVHDARKYENYHGVQSYVAAGHLAEIALEGGYADGTLAQLTGRYNYFQKLSEKLVFSTDWRAGIMPVDGDEIGPTERFYLGGGEDLRGFKYRHAGIHDSGDEDVPLGGATKLLVRNELRYPLARNLTGLFFVDGGMLDHDALSVDTPRFSTGLGIRLDLKGVQAGVDLALPVNSQDDDQKRYFHLSLSTVKGF